MTSEKRLLANRANGALSRGPITPVGKAYSSRNATRHGLLAKCVVLGGESVEAFHQVLDLHIERFSPEDDVELGMVEEMASACWRLRRVWAIENRKLDIAIDNQPLGDEMTRMTKGFDEVAAKPELNLLHRYETRLHLIYQRAFHNLLLLRKLGVPNEPNKSFVSNQAIDVT